MSKASRSHSGSGKTAAVAHEPTGLRLMREAQELARMVPKEEWDKMPKDLLDNLDHYLYGAPRKPPRR